MIILQCNRLNIDEKAMQELSKSYQPQENEDVIYKQWEESGYFNPDNLDLPEDAPSYSIVLPPPNITDKLHLGHSSMLAIEDLLIRYHRMNGYRTLWVPGTDHAAIATQNVVEKKLFAETGKTRHDLGRDKFLKKVWKFLEETQATILNQTRKMGASLDWSREAFTLDESRQKAVIRMFVDMYEAGVIYQGERIVNWCPRCNSTLADDEVEHEDQKAMFYTFRYWKDFPIAISTTRPETKIGDTAVAVNPKDERYKKFIGQTFEGEFCGINLNIKIIADREVDMDLGTGALGVTPAHSMVDWKMAEDNNLEIKKVINETGNIHEGFGEFSGLTAKEAQLLVVKKLKEAKLIEKEDEIDNALSICYRCNTAIEPLPSKQWFVGVDKKLERLGGKSLKERAIEVAKEKDINFIPNRFEKRYIDWMENLHDWCISRQIWFGHRIPVWYRNKSKVKSQKSIKSGIENISSEIYVGINPPKDIENWTQDSDALDTWFSSGMWTFSTMGWPDNFKDGKKSGDLQNFHPTQVLETGYEILTLWVSRMIMMSLFAVGEIPFKDVYLHGMVLDEHGKKMSKSKGNGIDPMDVIGEFGTDAVRLSLLIGNTPGNNLRVGEEKIAGMRNLVNKLWNISRYIETKYVISELEDTGIKTIKKTATITIADQWIISKFTRLVEEVTNDVDNYRFSDAGEKLKEFTWDDLADWYLEISKSETNTSEKVIILKSILGDLLKLWHPLIPFVTEKIWQELFSEKLLMVEKWPNVSKYNEINSPAIFKNFDLFKNLITTIRNIRAQYKIAPSQKIDLIIYAHKYLPLVKEQESLILNLKTGIKILTIQESGEKMDQAHYVAIDDIEIYVPLQGIIDIDKEKKRLSEEMSKIENFITAINNKLSNKSFASNAPKEIIKKEKEKLLTQESKLKNLKEHLENIN
jgi:valyl-tRNA synthetase